MGRIIEQTLFESSPIGPDRPKQLGRLIPAREAGGGLLRKLSLDLRAVEAPPSPGVIHDFAR